MEHEGTFFSGATLQHVMNALMMKYTQGMVTE
jgi:hypothetical protein